MRRTYHWDAERGVLVEGPAPRRGSIPTSDAFYAMHPFKAHDGTVIDSKAKHRAYMKRHGLTTVDDYKQTWNDAAVKRADVFEGRANRDDIKRDIAQSIDKIRR